MRIDWRRPDVLVLDDVFDDTELATLSDVVASLSFDPQAFGRGMAPGRSRERAQVDSVEVANILWWHLAEHVSPLTRWFEGRAHGIRLDPELECWVPSECNTRSRFYRYQLGADFREHEDEAWRPTENVRSFLTVLVYLPTAQPCVGGETVIDGEVVSVEPGRVVVFPHDLLHEGRPVESGQKLVLRNDVIGIGVSGDDAHDWLAAGLSPAQVAAVADRTGWSHMDTVKLLTSEFEDIGIGAAKELLYAIRGREFRQGQNDVMVAFAYVMTLPSGVSAREIDAFEEKTGFGLKLQALTRADRYEDFDAALDRLDPDELAVRELSIEEARQLAVDVVAGWSADMALMDEHTSEYDFGWTFVAQSPAYVESGDPLDMVVGHGPIVVDRFTGALWETGSVDHDWLNAYRETGDPTATR